MARPGSPREGPAAPAEAEEKLVPAVAVEVAGDHVGRGRPQVDHLQDGAVRRLQELHSILGGGQQLQVAVAVGVTGGHQGLHLGVVAVLRLPPGVAAAAESTAFR